MLPLPIFQYELLEKNIYSKNNLEHKTKIQQKGQHGKEEIQNSSV